MREIVVRRAKVIEHSLLCKIAKSSPYTRDFTNRVMFSSDAAYAKGWIRVAEEDDAIVGFYCIRHKLRGDRATKLYFITVAPPYRSSGVGETLITDLKKEAEQHGGVVELDVAKENTRALEFYKRHKFSVVHGDALGGEAWRMQWSMHD